MTDRLISSISKLSTSDTEDQAIATVPVHNLNSGYENNHFAVEWIPLSTTLLNIVWLRLGDLWFPWGFDKVLSM